MMKTLTRGNGMNGWYKAVVAMMSLSMVIGCAAQSPYTTAGAAVGGGLGALTGAAIDNRNPWRGAAIGGLIGGVAGGVAGDAAARSRYPQAGYYQQPYYGYYQNQPYDRNYGYNDGYYPPPSNNNYGRPYPPPGYRQGPPYVAQSPDYVY
jgi:hypothetical protein